MFVVKNRKIFYALSASITGAALIALIVFGLTFGIDFTGGSLIEVKYPDGRPSIEDVKKNLGGEIFTGSSLRPAGENGYILRTKFLSVEAHQEALTNLSDNGAWKIEETRFNAIGPTIGNELRTKALIALALVILAIVLFIAFVFRKVSKPVASWKYGLIAIVALLHDVIVPTGAFAILGYLVGTEVDTLFVTALLVILGFSIHDTIVVFDRVRENLRINIESNKKEQFEETVGRSVSQTFNRSINTSLTTILSLVALYFLGSESTQDFSLALIIGIAAGTYSSIFLASPLLVTVEKLQSKK